jgi:hypothetical protein
LAVKAFLASTTPDAIARQMNTGISPALGEMVFIAKTLD